MKEANPSEFSRAVAEALAAHKSSVKADEKEWRVGLRAAEAIVGLDVPSEVDFEILLGALHVAAEYIADPCRHNELAERGRALQPTRADEQAEPCNVVAILPIPADETLGERLKALGLGCNTDRRRRNFQQLWEGRAVVNDVANLIVPIGGTVNVVHLPTAIPIEEAQFASATSCKEEDTPPRPLVDNSADASAPPRADDLVEPTAIVVGALDSARVPDAAPNEPTSVATVPRDPTALSKVSSPRRVRAPLPVLANAEPEPEKPESPLPDFLRDSSSLEVVDALASETRN